MTREEAKRFGHCILAVADANADKDTIEFTKIALEALEQEPCDDCCNGNQIEKAKLCQKSYIAGMEHKQELKTDVLDKITAEINAMFPLSGAWMYEEGHEVEHTVCEVLSDVLQIIDKYRKGGKE